MQTRHKIIRKIHYRSTHNGNKTEVDHFRLYLQACAHIFISSSLIQVYSVLNYALGHFWAICGRQNVALGRSIYSRLLYT